ncbi:HlyD family secretion protein [Flavobacterium sp. PL02]|uniref:HlyD family secretion protein n=1 Tax=Flavobacterium sp. PL02 TaxID=3088354 RepID=UPI002B223243|nr:HlyD family efflux transporter periplasmic adaptor subunit [Flavobacterium sp. PL02]MEA9414322.1 HlyD family efflux transporter periplasmic adaptor subunit [Flavobacterium sp. PL02]
MDNIKPNILSRYGTPITFGILLFVGILTWFIQYPETVSSKAKLTGSNAPKPIMAKQAARLISLDKKNGSLVNKGDIIGSLESTAQVDEVLQFSKFIDEVYTLLQEHNPQTMKLLMKSEFSHLGELQGDYQVFMQAYIPYRDYVLGDYSNKKKNLLNKDLNNAHQSRNVLNEQKDLYNADLQLNLTTLEKNKQLLEEKIISEQEFRELTSQNIGKKMSQPQMKSNYINNSSELNGIQKEIVELDKEIVSQQALFQQVVYNLKSKIDDWKNRYLLVATEKGKLVFTSFLQENQIVQAGKIIAYIIPENSEIYVESLVPQGNFGKVKEGQKVFLKFNAYPSHEYGKVTGKVEYISPIPADSGYYLVKVILPDHLKTNYNKEIPFIEGLTVQSDIVTKDMRLAESLYYDVIKQMKK